MNYFCFPYYQPPLSDYTEYTQLFIQNISPFLIGFIPLAISS